MLDASYDAKAMLKYLGKPLVWTAPDGTAVETLGILDQPDQAIPMGANVQAMGTAYAVQFITSELPLVVNGDRVTFDGMPFLVKDVAAISDGVFSRAALKRDIRA